jgi:hypothetical protein
VSGQTSDAARIISAIQSEPMEIEPKARRTMNRWEAEYAARLESMKLSGAVLWWGYETDSLKLADGARYTPDFHVILSSGQHEFHEVKGHWREAARVRIKVAADRYRMWARFIAVTKRGGGWAVEEF